MSIKASHVGHVTVLELNGKLMGGSETKEIRDEVEKLIKEGKTQFVFDLGNIKWMNSSGLGAIVSCHNLVKEAGGALKLARVEQKIESLLVVTHLIKVFECHKSVEAAVDSF
ncbi:MAG: STAS domain-containing protein [Bacteroidetes bacterium]|nr:STAS domain-containing protein [Bacteroidota bacterium]